MAYHYTESGLDNIWLLDGYKIHNTKHGRGASVDNTEGLHRTIARLLIESPTTLNGAELRFLRLEMETSQKQLAQIIGSTEQSILRWERARKRNISGPADRVIRILYKQYIGGGDQLGRMVERWSEFSAKLDQNKRKRAQFRETASGWKVEESAWSES
jgi:DNA-binding transcriptional regulator YiaG